jgi:anion-transporting  ArsA/GET3 family ATPase
VLDNLVRARLPLGVLARRTLASPIYEHVAEGAPGLKELAVLLHARGLGSAHDVVVLDAPATGHALSLLAAPALVAEVVQRGPFGRLAEELAEWIADPRRCALAVVTAAEEMPTQEALELLAALRRDLGRDADLVVVNGLYPELPAPRRWRQPRRGAAATPWS